MIRWAPYAFVRLTLALMAGILTYLYLGQRLPELLGGLAVGVATFFVVQLWASRQSAPGAADAAGWVALLCVYGAGLTLAQHATGSRLPDSLSQLQKPVEFYRAVVDDYTVARAATYATTLRVSAVRVGGRWQAATGGVRVTVLCDSATAAPRYGDVWLVRGAPLPVRPPLNPGEFDYRRYLGNHQIFHQQFLLPDQYRRIGFQPPSYLRAVSMRAARVLDGVFQRYVRSPREYALASALVLGIKDDVDQQTKQAYAATGTTHIMAVSGLQVGLLFAVLTWLLKRFFGAARGFRYWSAGVGLAVVWSYAFVTGLSPSVLRAAVMISFLIVGRAAGRQSNIYNTLAVAAFVLLCYDPCLLADVGFQLSFLAVLSIVYVQPRIAGWINFNKLITSKIRSWQPRRVRWSRLAAGWSADKIWQATALSLAAQVGTFPLGLYYFHQFPLSFLLSNLVAVPISSVAVIVGLILLAVKGLVACVQAVVPSAGWLDLLPRLTGRVFEGTIWLFNEYIFWVGRALPGALVGGIHLTLTQAWLMGAVLLALLVFFTVRRLPWLGVACSLLGIFAGSRVWAARQLSREEQFIVYSVPHRSVCGFWQGSVGQIVALDSVPLSAADRQYRIEPGSVLREARQTSYHAGWRTAPMPAIRTPDGVVLAVWRGVRLAFVAGRLDATRRPSPVDVVVLRRNARVAPEELTATFGRKATFVIDSSCKSWYATRQDSLLQSAGLQVHNVAARGAFVVQSRP